MPPSTEPEFAIFAAFGARVRARRKALRLSLERLGRRSRVNWSYIGEIERGEANPTLVIMARLAVTLEIDLGELTTDLPPPPPGPDPDE